MLETGLLINETADEVFSDALKKGLWNDIKTTGDFYRALKEEVTEAQSEVNRLDNLYLVSADGVSSKIDIPKGEAVELADVMIFIMSYFRRRGWNLEEILRIKIDYNKIRERP